MERGEWIDPSLSSITFAEWSTKWLEAKTDITPSTRRGYIGRLNTHLLPAFGDSKLTSITNNEIGQWIAKSVENGDGLTALKQSHGVLRQILKAAVLDGRLIRNAAEGVPLPRTKPKEQTALTLVQLRALAKECGEFQTLVILAGTTGMRWGEIAALQCKDVSLLNKTLYVGKAISTGLKGERVLGGTKTHQNRTIPFSKELLPALTLLIENKNRVLSKSLLLDEVWGITFESESTVADTYISYLRKKVDSFDPPLIHTVRGVGYRLRMPPK
jgi:integrase